MRKFVSMSLLCLMVIFIMARGTFASTVYVNSTGNWNDPTHWSTGAVPLTTSTDELKLCGSSTGSSGDSITTTVNTNVGYYNSGSLKIETVRDCTLKIEDGGYVGNNKEVVIGKADASSSGTDNGYLVQTGGQLDIDGTCKLELGYKALASGTDGGVYTISGGSLTGTTGKMYIGCSGGTGAVGKINVVGNAATISIGGEMYVANDSSTANNYTGTGSIDFTLNALGDVSKIQVLKTIIDSQNSSAAVANLLIELTGAAPVGNLLLIENTGTSSVVGKFDTLNGGSAAEGATVVLGGNTYTLTYQYIGSGDGVANDIALLLTPEPASIALLGLGLLAIRRNKK